MAETPGAERMARMRRRARARTQVETGGGSILPVPDLIARHADGTLWQWTPTAGWTRLT